MVDREPGDLGDSRPVRGFDWSRTPLGDPSGWPPHLTAAVVEAMAGGRFAGQSSSVDVSADLEAMNRLYEVSEKLVQAGNDLHSNLEFIVETAIALSGADKGNLQILDTQSQVMRLVAQHGFAAPFLDFFADVTPDGASACAAAMAAREQVVVEDITKSPVFAGQQSLQVMLDDDVRAVQSTPLLSSSGAVCGIISTHWSRPCTPSARELRLLNLLARLTADYLERKQSEAAIADGQQRLGVFLENSAIVGWLKDENLRFAFMSDNFKERFQSYDWLGKTDYDVWPREVADQFRRNDQAVLENDGPVEAMEYSLDMRGGLSWWFTRKFTFRDARGHRYVGGLAVDITASRAAEAEKAYLASIVANSAEAIYSITLDWKIASWNGSAERLFGFTAEEMIGASLTRVVPGDKVAELEEVLARIQRGDSSQCFESVRLHKDGHGIDVQITVSPILDESAKVVGASMIIHDISEQRRVQEREQILLREVNHRAKNMLSLVQAIARHTAASDPPDFIARFEARLQSLSAAQNLLIKHEWNAVPLTELVSSQLSHFADLFGCRIRIDGPDLRMRPEAAQTIGIALHELATNAAKYGSLSTATGLVSIGWRIEREGGERFFSLSWRESLGPLVTKPDRRGFGSDVTGRLLKLRFEAEVETDFASDGLDWRLRVHADKVIEQRRGARGDMAGAEASTDCLPKGRRVLVVEDEAITALDIENCLKRAGFDVVGPVSSAKQALRMIERSCCDAAVLDVTLTDGSVEPVAGRLDHGGIPYVIVSGYTRQQLPELLQAAPVLAKPFDVQSLISEVRGCLGRNPAIQMESHSSGR